MGCADDTFQASQCYDGSPDSEVAGSPTCERPGEGAGWGLEGDPVIGCGALFISWGSAWGGRRVPVYKAGGKNKTLIVFAYTENSDSDIQLYSNKGQCAIQYSDFMSLTYLRPSKIKSCI